MPKPSPNSIRHWRSIRNNIAAWCNRGNALQALERDSEAVESFGKALVLAPKLVVVHFNMANALERLGRHEEAIARFRRAIALKPDLAEAYINLAGPLAALNRWAEVVECSDQAIRLRPNAVQPYCNRGQALWQLERHYESIASYDAALAIDANYVRALIHKASQALVVGQLGDLLAAAEKVYEVAPNQTLNYLMLAEIKQFTAGDPQIAMMERLLQQEPINADERIVLHFALGKIYRKVGEHARSFQHLLEGNALKRRQFDYDGNLDIKLFARLREIFTPEFMATRSGHGNPSAQPIFIVGMPRSGSTLLEQMLAGHPRVHAVGEKPNLHDAIAALTDPNYPDNIAAMSGEEFGKLGADYLARATASMPTNKDRFTDKVPGNIVNAGLIHLALPNARIIHTRRDPVDNCLSCFSQLFLKRNEFSYDLGELGRFFRAVEELAAYWRDVLPAGVMLDVQYEDVVADIETQARRILDFCGLEWDEACLAFDSVERPIHTASMSQVRQPLYASSVGRGRVYQGQLQPLLEALGQRE